MYICVYNKCLNFYIVRFQFPNLAEVLELFDNTFTNNWTLYLDESFKLASNFLTVQ